MNRKPLPMVVCGLLVHTALSVWAAEPQTEQEKAVVEIKKLGGSVAIDEKSPDKPVIGVALPRTKVTDAGLEHLKGLPKLQWLSLLRTKVTDAGVKDLKKALPNVQIIR
jgi:hypothetical protein